MTRLKAAFAATATRPMLVAGLLAAGLLTALAAAQRSRDDWQRVPDVIAALAIPEGSHVADVGAGSGYFTEHLARAVGASGRVFAVDGRQRITTSASILPSVSCARRASRYSSGTSSSQSGGATTGSGC